MHSRDNINVNVNRPIITIFHYAACTWKSFSVHGNKNMPTKPIHCMQKWRGWRSGRSHNMNNVNVHLGRQKRGPQLKECQISHAFFILNNEWAAGFQVCKHSGLHASTWTDTSKWLWFVILYTWLLPFSMSLLEYWKLLLYLSIASDCSDVGTINRELWTLNAWLTTPSYTGGVWATVTGEIQQSCHAVATFFGQMVNQPLWIIGMWPSRFSSCTLVKQIKKEKTKAFLKAYCEPIKLILPSSLNLMVSCTTLLTIFGMPSDLMTQPC